MATLDQIVKSLGSVYDPLVKNYQTRQAAIPGQIAEEEKGLGAKQENAFGEILGGARRRGLGFSGIPLQEQAKYTATEYLPALARLRQTGKEQAMSLEDAVLGLNRERRTQGQSIYEADRQYGLADRQFKESRRQFDAQMKAQAEQARQSAAAARAAAFQPSFGSSASATAAKKPTINDQAYLSVQKFLQADDSQIKSDYAATLKSANYGNALDKLKVQLYQQSRPDLFKPKVTTGPTKIPFKGGFYSSPASLGKMPVYNPLGALR